MSDLATTQQTEKMAKAVHDLLGEGKCPWTMPQLALIRERTDSKVDNPSFLAFLHTAANSGLDPLSNDIYAVAYFDKRENKNKTSIITGIGGLRKIAQRTGRFLGMTAPIYYDSDGKAYEVWTKPGLPHAVKSGVWVKDAKEPSWGPPVLTSEFKGQYGQWPTKGVHMITKVSRAHALREVFPECNGLYEESEEDAIVGRRFVDNEAEPKAPVDLGLSEPPTVPEPEQRYTPKPPDIVAEAVSMEVARIVAPPMPMDSVSFVTALEEACQTLGFDTGAPGWILAKLAEKHKVKDVHYTTTAQRGDLWASLHAGKLDKFKTADSRKKKEPTNG